MDSSDGFSSICAFVCSLRARVLVLTGECGAKSPETKYKRARGKDGALASLQFRRGKKEELDDSKCQSLREMEMSKFKRRDAPQKSNQHTSPHKQYSFSAFTY